MLAQWFGRLRGVEKDPEPQLCAIEQMQGGTAPHQGQASACWGCLSGTKSEAFPHSYCWSPSAIYWLTWEGPMDWDSQWVPNALFSSRSQDSDNLTPLNWGFSRHLLAASLDPWPTPFSKELWFPFRFYVFPSCPACWMEHMTLAKPNMHSNPLAAYKDWLRKWACELSQSSHCDSQEFCWEYWDKSSLSWWMRKRRHAALGTAGSHLGMIGVEEPVFGYIWHHGRESGVKNKTKLSSWISPCQVPERRFSTFMFSHH